MGFVLCLCEEGFLAAPVKNLEPSLEQPRPLKDFFSYNCSSQVITLKLITVMHKLGLFRAAIALISACRPANGTVAAVTVVGATLLSKQPFHAANDSSLPIEGFASLAYGATARYSTSMTVHFVSGTRFVASEGWFCCLIEFFFHLFKRI